MAENCVYRKFFLKSNKSVIIGNQCFNVWLNELINWIKVSEWRSSKEVSNPDWLIVKSSINICGMNKNK